MENKATPTKMDLVTAAQALAQVPEEASLCEPTNSLLVGRAVVQFSQKVAMAETERMDSAHQDQHASASTMVAKAVAVAAEAVTPEAVAPAEAEAPVAVRALVALGAWAAAAHAGGSTDSNGSSAVSRSNEAKVSKGMGSTSIRLS